MNSKRRIFYPIFLFICFLVLLANLGLFFYSNQNNNAVMNPGEALRPDFETTKKNLETLVPSKLKVAERFQTGEVAKERTLMMPDGFSIEVYGQGFKQARYMDFDDSDNLIVIDRAPGKVVMLKDEDGDGLSDEQIIIDEGLQIPNGVDFFHGDLYVAEEHQVVVYRKLGTDGKFETKQVLIPNIPLNGGHNTRSVKVGEDQKIYVSIGSTCDVCEERDPRRAVIMRYNIDGTGEERFATGLRNTVGYEFRNVGGKAELWGVDHGRDSIGDDIPPDEVNLIELGQDYGWPYCYGDQIPNPEFPDRGEYCTSQTVKPKYGTQAHSAPLGINFYPKMSNFPVSLKNNAFVGYHGSSHRTQLTGYKIMRVDLVFETGKLLDFITGFLDSENIIWGRPVDLKFDSKGDLYISDDFNGNIYKVSYKKP